MGLFCVWCDVSDACESHHALIFLVRCSPKTFLRRALMSSIDTLCATRSEVELCYPYLNISHLESVSLYITQSSLCINPTLGSLKLEMPTP